MVSASEVGGQCSLAQSLLGLVVSAEGAAERSPVALSTPTLVFWPVFPASEGFTCPAA